MIYRNQNYFTLITEYLVGEMLKRYSTSATYMVAGVDEAGRGCLAGPVVAAAVILPAHVEIPGLNDSKLLTHKQRMLLRPLILEKAHAWCIGMISSQRIDQVNILNASFESMHEAIQGLCVAPQILLIDGNRFHPYPGIHHECVIKGDSKYLSIAAASILAKTYRDEVMCMLHEQYCNYGWEKNKGYPTKTHKMAIAQFGPTPYHRKSFRWAV